MKQLNYDLILDLLENNRRKEIANYFNESHPADIAHLINNLPADYQFIAFSVLDAETASDVLSELYDEIRDHILEHTKQERIVKIIDEMETDEAADIISEMEDEISHKVLEKIDKEDSQIIKQLLAYDEETAGGLMQSEIIAINEKWNRDVIIDYIRENYLEVENIHYAFVVDDDNKLIGILEITRLLVAKKDRIGRDLMETDFISANVNMDQELVANLFRKYDIYILPVVDNENHLLGRITVDDIIDVIDEEASEDAYKLVGLDNEDKVFTPPLSSVKKRLPWLTLNLFTALLISSVVGIFEPTIAKYSFLAVLMPIVAGLGGNSGTQTLTVITRGIALEELTIHNTSKAILKQVSIGVINGVLVGTFTMLIIYLLRGNILLGAILGLAMICNMFIAGLVGSAIPVILKKLKIDPALASSVIITMLTDIGGYASFLGLAKIMLT